MELNRPFRSGGYGSVPERRDMDVPETIMLARSGVVQINRKDRDGHKCYSLHV